MAKQKYKIAFAPAALRQLRKLPEQDRKRIVREIGLLETNPRPSGAKKLRGADTLWRIRVGDYRVVYEIEDARLTVLVLRVAHRKDIYRKGK